MHWVHWKWSEVQGRSTSTKMQWRSAFYWTYKGKAIEHNSIKWRHYWWEHGSMHCQNVWQTNLVWIIWLHLGTWSKCTIEKDIPSRKGKLEDAKHAVENSSKSDKNGIFTAYMCRDKPNKLTSLQLTSPMNTVVSFLSLITIKEICLPLYWVMKSG